MKKNVLIIGGMGPQASLLLHKRIIDKAVELGARNGSDFPAITHVSLPVDDFISSAKNIDKAIITLRQGLRYLWQYPVFTHYYCM